MTAGAIVEGDSWSGETNESCDVVVIGSGCGGATVALALAERGHSVIILERGGYYTAADMDQREANMLAKIDGGRGLETSGDGSVLLSYGNNVGGASVHYWADSYRLPSDRLEVWQDRYGLEGHGADVLTPHFERLETDLSVHLATEPYVNRMNELFRDAAQTLGWKAARVPQARKGCVMSGHCMQGCAYDAKQSQLVTHIPRAVALGARVYADVDATRLLWEGGTVRKVVARVLDRATGRPRGPTVQIEAKAVVLAAGGYGTPRFLMRQGFKDRLPALGEFLFCNPCPMVHARFAEPVIQWRNIPAAWAVEAFRVAKTEGERYIEGGYLLMPNQLHPGALAAVLPSVGSRHRAFLRDYARTGGTIAWVDDVNTGRMTLGVGGQTRVDFPLGADNGLRIRDAWRKQAKLLFTAGATDIAFGDLQDSTLTADQAGDIDAAVDALSLEPGRNVFAAPHPGGGARMGKDPTASVVGFDHRVHGSENLFVSDPSVFPSPPSVDPSLTIMAFAYVAADRIHEAL